MTNDEFENLKQKVGDCITNTEKLLLPNGNWQRIPLNGWDAGSSQSETQAEYMAKSSSLYTPPPVEYVEPVEDLYDWYTGKVRE